MATQEQRELEDKYDVGADFALPALDEFVPAGGRLERAELTIESVYFDTADRDLLRNAVTLRRRSGDSDTGWQMKVPAGPARTEIRLEPTPGKAVPKELRDLTRGLRRGRELQPVALLRMTRAATRIFDDHDAMIVEVALGAGAEDILARLERHLRKAGAVPATSRSKLARALAVTGERATAKAGRSAGEVVLGYLSDQRTAILQGDLAQRRGRDVIHPTRVATRRFRSALRVFADLFDADRAAALDVELAWYARLLGAVRDRQVQRGRFARAVADLADELVLGPVAATIDQQLSTEQERHARTLARALNGARYLALLDGLADFFEAPPFTAEAGAPPKSLARTVRGAEGRVASRLRIAFASGEDAALHRARKAAKRARYALEATASVNAVSKAELRIKRHTKLQEILGEHQDSLVAANLLLTLGRSTGTSAGQNGFTYGLLYAREQENARRSAKAARRWRR